MVLRLLFVCTHNRCRSLLSEVIVADLLGDKAVVKSAGTTPADKPHPGTLAQLRRRGFNTDGLYSKSFEDIRGFAPDLVITVCDAAANEACPVWLGGAVKAHWGLTDPSSIDDDEEAERCFDAVVSTIQKRAARLAELLEYGDGRTSGWDLEIAQIGEIQ